MVLLMLYAITKCVIILLAHKSACIILLLILIAILHCLILSDIIC